MTEDVTITLPGNRACSTTGAVCSKGDDPVQLSNSPTTTVAGPPEVVAATPNVSIAGGSGKEGDEDDIDFTVTLDEAASGTVTVDYATSDGSADAGDDYTAKSGTLTFSAGTTSKTISVAIGDDIENESDETFTVTLSNPSGADLGTATATGTIRNRRVEPLTASFSGMPTEHDGSSFTFELEFSENVEAGFRKIRDRAFTLDEADITHAKRKNPQSADKNKAWTITVEPDGNDTISLTLPGNHQLQQQSGHLHRRRAEAQPLDVHDGRRPGRHLGGRRRGRGGRRRRPGLPGSTHPGGEQRPDGRLLNVGRYRYGRRRLHVDLRNTDDRRGQLVGDRRGVGHRRRAQRGQRDVHADAVERLKRDADRRERHRNHHQPRCAAGRPGGPLRPHGRRARGRPG